MLRRKWKIWSILIRTVAARRPENMLKWELHPLSCMFMLGSYRWVHLLKSSNIRISAVIRIWAFLFVLLTRPSKLTSIYLCTPRVSHFPHYACGYFSFSPYGLVVLKQIFRRVRGRLNFISDSSCPRYYCPSYGEEGVQRSSKQFSTTSTFRHLFQTFFFLLSNTGR